MRRNHREALFLDWFDYLSFYRILGRIHEKYAFELPCYCLMTNHYHFMLRSREHPISKVMSLINKRYADYYNNRYRLKGHLFEKRYFSKEITNDHGILEVSRYIHRNPIEAKMVANLEDYQWSTYPLYMNPKVSAPLYTNKDIIFRYYSGQEKEKIKKYQEYCNLSLS